MGIALKGQITPKGVHSKVRQTSFLPPYLWFFLPASLHLHSLPQESESSKHTLLECAVHLRSKRKVALQKINYKCKWIHIWWNPLGRHLGSYPSIPSQPSSDPLHMKGQSKDAVLQWSGSWHFCRNRTTESENRQDYSRASSRFYLINKTLRQGLWRWSFIWMVDPRKHKRKSEMRKRNEESK